MADGNRCGSPAACAREVHEVNGHGETMAGLLVFAAYTGLRPGSCTRCATAIRLIERRGLEIRAAMDGQTTGELRPFRGLGGA